MQNQVKDRLIDVPEICFQLGIGKSTVYELFASGKLKKVKLGRSTKVSELQVQALLKAGVETGAV
jgi:excisionase family DNA binding protein